LGDRFIWAVIFKLITKVDKIYVLN
jgi:hypothetical protein